MTARLGPLHGGGLWGAVAVVLAFLAVSMPQYGQPYVIDEAVFPYSSAGILLHGAPYFYNGETRPHDLGLWHPPLYEYLLALEMLAFGTSSFVVRSFGAICVITSFYVLSVAMRRIAPNLPQYGYVVLAALFLLNPLVLSDALVPDIDGTLGLVLVAFALWIATVLVQRPLSPRLLFALFAFAALAVSTKYILAGIVAVLVGCAALLAPEQRWRKVLVVFSTFAVGAAASLAVLFGLGVVLHFDARGPFSYLLSSLGTRAPGKSGWWGMVGNLLGGPGSNVVWIGPAIILSGALAWVIVIVLRPPNVSRRLIGLAVLSSFGIILGYSYITGSPYGFPKYTNIAVPGLALAITALVALGPTIPADEIRRPVVVRRAVAGYVSILIGGTAITVLAASHYEFGYVRKIGELVALFGVDAMGVAVATALLLLLIARPAASARRGAQLRRLLVVGVLAVLVLAPAMVQASSSVVNLVSPYATRYYYGERGMAYFLVHADGIVPKGQAIIAPKDVGLQLNRPFYEDAFLLPLSPAKLRTELTKIDVPWLATRDRYDYSEGVFPKQFAVLREFYTPVLSDSHSDFVLWKHR